MWNDSLGKTKNREHWLDIAKFFGILLVVLNHRNIHIPLVTFFGGMFYMPVFFVAAGYTYRRKGESFKTFALGKANRLLIPYAVCNVFLFVFFSILNGKFSRTNFLGMFYSRSMMMKATSNWNMALMSNLNAPTWFLTCLFVCLCIYYLLDQKFSDAKKRRIAVAVCMAAGVVLRKFSPVLLPWSIENALFFTGMIEAGRFLKEEGISWLRKHEWIYVNILIVFVALSYIQGTVNVSISEYGRSMALYFFTGTLGSVLCMKAAELTEKYLKVFAKPLAFVGRHTLPILCWHLFMIEIIEKAFRMLGI